MNVLIVSFDKNLVNRVKEVLGEHNVVDVKNGEEAINTVSSYMDVVIYDAVSGSISEEDINNMYRQKFKDSKYIVLVDDLFPVDMNNILPPRKIKVMRDEAVEKIPRVLFEEAGEEKAESFIEEVSLPYSESVVSLQEEEGVREEVGMEEVFGFRELELSTSRKKLLLVSFDTSLINNIKEALSDRVEMVEAKNTKEAIEKAREADIILFDTISGMLAYRTLSDMAKDDSLARKPYVLLIDELFTIDVGSIPLERKYAFAREAELSKALEKITELLEEAPAEYHAEAVLETPLSEERLPTDLQPATLQEEERSIMSLLEEIIGVGFEETGEQERMPLSPEEEKVPEVAMTEEASVPQRMPYMENLAESLAMAIKEVIREELSKEKFYSALSNILSAEEIGRQLSNVLERKLEQILKEKVNEVLSGIDVSKIVREEAYRVMKERLSELIT